MNRPSAMLSSHVLLVEGRNDCHVVRHLRERHPSTPRFQVEAKDGREKLLDSIGLAVRDRENRQAVGILMDADDDLRASWDAAADRLKQECFQVPSHPDPAGTIIDGEPRVGVWLMPDNESPGELEDFVARMIPHDDPVWPRSQCYIDGIPAADRKFKGGKTLRAQIHAWLAAREDPRQMGGAIGTGDLETDGELCRKFVAWLTELFG